MTWIIDAHQDLAYNMLAHGRDYRRPAAETRRREEGSLTLQRNGECLLGWEDYQRGQIALVFATLYVSPAERSSEWDNQRWSSCAEARRLQLRQYALYRDFCDQNAEQFRFLQHRAGLSAHLAEWNSSPLDFPQQHRPVGLVLLMEGAEGLPSLAELPEWHDRGLRLLGPVWGGGRYCGASFGGIEPFEFTREGFELLDRMADLGMGLDVSHMNHRSLLQAADTYAGETIFASHIACERLYGDPRGYHERMIDDAGIAHLIERDGVIGIVPSNRFLRSSWQRGDPRDNVTLEDLAAHIDHICQMAGNTRHAALGTDFDGGFGREVVPAEIDSIADVQKLKKVLLQKGYNHGDIDNIFHGNWQRVLESVFR